MSRPVVDSRCERAGRCLLGPAGRLCPGGGRSFADRDLSDNVWPNAVSDYPHGLAPFARQQPDMPWMYTGALENRRRWSTRSRDRPLWGVPGTCCTGTGSMAGGGCRSCRGTHAPGTRRHAPRRAAAGRLVVQAAGLLWRRADHIVGDPSVGNISGAGPPERYYQQQMDGTPCGAVYVAAAGRARLLGVTRQLVGPSWTGATGFQYGGSVGPVRLAGPCVEQFRRLGDCLAAAFELVGLFGVDAVVRDDTVWPVEVNPRYPRSSSLERALTIKAIARHAAACCEGRLIDYLPIVTDGNRRCGKAVVYATDEVVVREEFSRRGTFGRSGPVAERRRRPPAGHADRRGTPGTHRAGRGSSESRVERQLRVAGGRPGWIGGCAIRSAGRDESLARESGLRYVPRSYCIGDSSNDLRMAKQGNFFFFFFFFFFFKKKKKKKKKKKNLHYKLSAGIRTTMSSAPGGPSSSQRP